MMFSDNPVRDWDNYCEEQLNKRPECCECSKPIQEEHCYEFEGEYICPECLNDNHKKSVEDVIK